MNPIRTVTNNRIFFRKNVEIINSREARVYLTSEAAQQEIHRKSRPSGVLPAVGPVPNYRFEFGDLKLFQEEIITQC